MTLDDFLREWHDPSDCLPVHTSGSTGPPKLLWAEKRRMEASARITCRFLGLQAGDTALLCLPLDYIAGKMMVVRAVTCGLRLVSVEPSGHPLRDLAEPPCFAAMVPLQVCNALQVPAERERLRAIRHLIIGGGAVDDDLARELRDFPNAVWSTYGMTETLSHIALRRLSGAAADDCYTPFDGVGVSLSPDGCLVIDAPQVCAERLVTNDLAEIDHRGRFRILGRKDNMICSGGMKIQIEEVERCLRRHTDQPFIIAKCKDKKFGEAMVLLTESHDIEMFRQLCRSCLPKFWQPRRIQTVDRLPMTETGKPVRVLR